MYITVCMFVPCSEDLMPSPIYLAYEISNSESFVREQCRSIVVLWTVRLQPDWKETAGLCSPGVPCSSPGPGMLWKPARMTSTSVLLVGCAEVGVSENPICPCSSFSRNTNLYSPFSLYFYVSIQESPQQLVWLVGLQTAPWGLSVTWLHGQREALTAKRWACVSFGVPKTSKAFCNM